MDFTKIATNYIMIVDNLAEDSRIMKNQICASYTLKELNLKISST